MKSILNKLWSDDSGAVLSVEWLLLTSVLVLGAGSGLVYTRNAVNTAFINVGDSIVALTAPTSSALPSPISVSTPPTTRTTPIASPTVYDVTSLDPVP